MDQISKFPEEEVLYSDALGPKETVEISERDILDATKEIGREWSSLGVQLGFQLKTLQHLEEIYPRQPEWRNFVMVAKWADMVVQLCLNVRLYLASALSKVGRDDIANKICDDYKDARQPEAIDIRVRNISFDQPIEKTLERWDLQFVVTMLDTPLQSRYEMNLTCSAFSAPKMYYGTPKLETNIQVYQHHDKKLEETGIHRLLEDLSLQRFYPSKIRIIDVRKIRLSKCEVTESDLPWLLLKKIFMLNYSAREEDLNTLYEKKQTNSGSDGDQFEDTTVNSINPCDLLYVTFLCCDPLLKLELVSKLFNCRLAIPFIFRDFNDHLILSRWSLRTMYIDEYTSNTGQLNALNHDTQIISFVRFGKQSTSKSKIINEVLSDRNHSVFFNRDCPLGLSDRKLANGLVEASWFIPSGKKSDTFNSLTLFLNLRGNCIEFDDQLKILCKLSHVIVVHVTMEQLSEKAKSSTLKMIHSHNIPVVYVLESYRDPKTNRQMWTEYETSMSQFKSNIRFVLLKSRQCSSDITRNLRKNLVQLLNASRIKPFSLLEKTNTLDIADEDISKCNESMEMAEQLMTEVSENICLKKREILTLQGEPWENWCHAEKRQRKAKSDAEIQTSVSNMNFSRDEQMFTLLNTLHPFMSKCLEIVLSKNADLCCVFTWIKILLEEKSRVVIPQLVHEYTKHCNALKDSVERNDQNWTDLKKQVDSAKQKLVEASFGIEHVFREMGQIYESLLSSKVYQNFIDELPMTVSKLIQQGHPIEIMDGDNVMVPIKWIKAVFRQLANAIGDKPILTISVLGIQSSGKSTLLNSMFGLQFPVSAGKCTRGVFAQLVHVTENILPYDYVLVIDTEGLRAPESDDQNHSHDNELATFVLGLGNITIINIKGENTTEIEDILQIAVHAFLRLKMTNRRLTLQQTCLLVHQNVPAINATEKLTYARQQMVDKLNKLTIAAAKQEGISDIRSFNQVLEINTETDILYFSDLFSGDPPMAPINLGYIQNVNDVYNKTLFEFGQKKKLLTISETILLIEDLWTGILSDDFVFKFRNSLEVKAHQAMENKYQEIAWNIEQNVQTHIRHTLLLKLKILMVEKELEDTLKQLIAELKYNIDQTVSNGESVFKSFISSSPLGNIMEQWQENRIIQLQNTAQQLFKDGTKTLTSIKTQTVSEIISRKRRKQHEKELRQLANKLASRCKVTSTDLSETELKITFDEMWLKCISKFEHEEKTEPRIIKDDVNEVLFEIFGANKALLLQEQRKTGSTCYTNLSMLYRSLSLNDITDEDISLCLEVSGNGNMTPDRHRYIPMAIKLADDIFYNLDRVLSKVSNEDTPFERAHVSNVLMKLKQYLDKHNEKDTQFTVTASFRAKLAVHVATYVTGFFEKMNTKYIKNHNVLEQIKAYKVSIYRFFKDEFENKRNEQKLSNLLGNSIKMIVHHEIERVLPQEVVKIILANCFNTKHTFLQEMLKDLAIKEEFTKYTDYFHHDKKFALKWIADFTNKYMFDGERYSGLVEELILKHFNIINECMKKSFNLDSHNKLDDWIHYFQHLVSREMPIWVEIPCIQDEFPQIDMLKVKEHVLDNLKHLRENLRSTFLINVETSTKKLDQTIYHTILDRLWGCKERCPFCGETCMNTSENHPNENHRCIQHRPKGAIGETFNRPNAIDLYSCNLFFYHRSHFSCSQAGFKCQRLGNCSATLNGNIQHPIKDFNKLIPDWNIEPYPTKKMPKYWMWFLYTFRRDLAKKYNCHVPREILKWKTISKEEAIMSLNN